MGTPLPETVAQLNVLLGAIVVSGASVRGAPIPPLDSFKENSS
jgi:hypothetical protein